MRLDIEVRLDRVGVGEIDGPRLDRVSIAADEELATLAKRCASGQRGRRGCANHAEVAAKLQSGKIVVDDDVAVGQHAHVQLQPIREARLTRGGNGKPLGAQGSEHLVDHSDRLAIRAPHDRDRPAQRAGQILDRLLR